MEQGQLHNEELMKKLEEIQRQKSFSGADDSKDKLSADDQQRRASYKLFDQGALQRFMIGTQLQHLKDATKFNLHEETHTRESIKMQNLQGNHQESN